MKQFDHHIPLDAVSYRSEKTRSDAAQEAERRAKALTKETGRKHSYRHAEKLERSVYEIFAIEREPIELAVAPLKEAALERAEKETREFVEKTRQELAAAGDDLTAIAPYPSMHESNSYGMAYHMKRYRHNLVMSFTKSKERHQSYTTSKPYYVEIEPAKVEKLVERRKREAAEQYDEFVAKLIGKIGHVKAAELTGSHVWAYSTLTVTKLDGSVERWKTQQIVNVSKLGKHFNQWPTRKVK
jgi:hypothetical protein